MYIKGQHALLKRALSLLFILVLSACSTRPAVRLPAEVIHYDLPNIIVGEFQYKGALNQIHNVGSGFRDALMDKMIEKRYFDVLNRRGLTDTITEFEIQNMGLTRPNGRIQPAMVKNARYIVRGAITEFATRVDASFIAEALLGVVGLEAKSDIISLQLMIEDLQTNQVIISEAITETNTSGNISYQNMTFGTQVFWDSPLGESTADALSRAIDYLIAQIPKKKWYASVIAIKDKTLYVPGDIVVLSGGMERGMKVGTQWRVVEQGQKLLDPNTLDDAGYAPYTFLEGIVVLQTINEKNAIAKVLEGNLHPGQTLSIYQVQKPGTAKQAH